MYNGYVHCVKFIESFIYHRFGVKSKSLPVIHVNLYRSFKILIFNKYFLIMTFGLESYVDVKTARKINNYGFMFLYTETEKGG